MAGLNCDVIWSMLTSNTPCCSSNLVTFDERRSISNVVSLLSPTSRLNFICLTIHDTFKLHYRGFTLCQFTLNTLFNIFTRASSCFLLSWFGASGIFLVLLLTNRNSPSLNSFRLLRKPFFPFASNFFSLAQLFYVQKFYTDFINTIESLAVTTSLFLILPWWGKSRPSCENCFRKIPASLDQSNFCFQVQGAKRKKIEINPNSLS